MRISILYALVRCILSFMCAGHCKKWSRSSVVLNSKTRSNGVLNSNQIIIIEVRS